MNRLIPKIQALLVLLLFFTACSLIISCSGKNYKNSLTEQHLNGKVKSLTETTYPTDKSGRISDTSFLEKISYRYDSQGNKIEEVHYYPDSVSDLITFKYNQGGKKVEKRWKDTINELDHLATFRYDKDGNKIEQKWSDKNGSLLKTATYSYDENGNQIAEEMISSEDSLNERLTFRYDNNHKLIEENSYNANDSITHRYTFKYLEFDRTGNWLKRLQFENNLPIRITIRGIEY